MCVFVLFQQSNRETDIRTQCQCLVCMCENIEFNQSKLQIVMRERERR